MFDWTRRLFAMALVATLSACGGGSDEIALDPPRNIVQIAQTDSRFTVLAEAVVAANLATALSAPGPLTVFAPTDAAFNALLTELRITKAQLLADRPLLTAVLQYHVLSSQVLRADVPLGRAITPLAGGIFKVDNTPAGLVITDGRNRTANITSTDIRASNGVIHVIDKVILPANRNIVETAVASNPEFSILVEAVVAANLQGTLSGAGPFTVFAPTNAAFAALLTELGTSKEALFADTALLTKVLTYHVVPSRVLKAEVPVGPAITTVNGETLTVNAALAITDRRGRTSNITDTDVLTSNGVIHVIDKVILPQNITLSTQRNIVQQAQALPQFSILVEAVVAANLQGVLSGNGPFTVFAPTNAAFAALLTELNITKEALLADVPLLTAVLQYHVLSSQVLRAQVPAGRPITPLAGGFFKVDAMNGALVVTDGRNRTATITATDMRTSNGVIHAVNKVLLPPNRNIVQTATALLPLFSVLSEALAAANLEGVLSGTGPFTVFAPTNEAFAALLAELNITKQALLADTALLTRVLTYHVLPSLVLKAGVPVGPAIATVEGGSFTVNAALAITDARGRASSITATDVLTSNGVIHVIDKVLLPAP